MIWQPHPCFLTPASDTDRSISALDTGSWPVELITKPALPAEQAWSTRLSEIIQEPKMTLDEGLDPHPRLITDAWADRPSQLNTHSKIHHNSKPLRPHQLILVSKSSQLHVATPNQLAQAMEKKAGVSLPGITCPQYPHQLFPRSTAAAPQVAPPGCPQPAAAVGLLLMSEVLWFHLCLVSQAQKRYPEAQEFKETKFGPLDSSNNDTPSHLSHDQEGMRKCPKAGPARER